MTINAASTASDSSKCDHAELIASYILSMIMTEVHLAEEEEILEKWLIHFRCSVGGYKEMLPWKCQL